MKVDDLGAGAHTPHDGWCDPNGLLWGFRRKAVELGAVYVKDRVVAAEVDTTKVRAVVLALHIRSGRALWRAERLLAWDPPNSPVPSVPRRRL